MEDILLNESEKMDTIVNESEKMDTIVNESEKMDTIVNESEKMDTIVNESEKMDVLVQKDDINEVSVNEIDYRDLLEEIVQNERYIIKLLEREPDVVIPSGNDNKYGGYDKSVYVSSDNIMYKPISDYSVSESIMLSIFVILLVGGIFISIRKAVGKWR